MIVYYGSTTAALKQTARVLLERDDKLGLWRDKKGILEMLRG